jgi:phosphatidylglycerol:prolipoprotein diacylglycerol transferase
MRASIYGWTMLAAIGASLWIWRRLFTKDPRLFQIYLGGLAGAMIGAKAVYILSEVWSDYHYPNFWARLLVGRSILGGILGGYAAVELVKKLVGYAESTGDRFAMVLPVSIAIGRIGCLNYGCCLGKVCEPAWYALSDQAGVPRWPAVPVEIAFNVVAALAFWVMRRKKVARDRHFFIYIAAYGVFRGGHEFFRDTPKLAGPFSGYFFASVALVYLGARGWLKVGRKMAASREQGQESS